VDLFSITLSPSIAQFLLMGILLVFLGVWMITFLMLALRSTSQQPVDTQQERVRPASRTQVASTMEAALEVEDVGGVTQIAS